MANGWEGATPALVDDSPGTFFELGTKYTALQDVTVSAIRVWHPATSASLVGRTARVWTSAGSMIAEVVLPNSLPSGWSSYVLATPIEFSAGSTFVISYSTVQYYGVVPSVSFPVDSPDGAVRITGSAFNAAVHTFPNVTSTSFFGSDIVYTVGITAPVDDNPTPLPVTGTLITLAQANSVASAFAQSVTAQGIALAELFISLRTGVEISDPAVVDDMDTTDRYWLAQAVVFQAIWAKGQPDLLNRIDQKQSTTDGDAIVFDHDGLILAPLAKWALLKTTFLSWATASSEPDERMLGTGVVSSSPEDVGWRRWHS